MPNPNVPELDPNAPAADPAASGAPAPASQDADPAAADPGAGGQSGEETSLSAAGETPLVPPAAGGEAEGAPAAKKETWQEAKIKRLTAKLHELQDKPAEAAAPAADPATPSAEERLNEAEIERRAREYSRQQLAIDNFNRQCKETADAGRQSYADFDSRITALRTAFSGGPEDMQQAVAYNQFIAAALETGQAPALLHTLGGDLDEAARIMSLPLVKMTVELTRLAGRAPDTSTTRVPKPITPVGSRGAAHTAIAPDDPERADKLTTAEWMARRNAQEKANFDARGRR